MSITIIPGTPAVPAVAAVPATPPKITAELTLHQALIIACLDGAMSPDCSVGFYRELNDHPLYAKYRARRDWMRNNPGQRQFFPDYTPGV